MDAETILCIVLSLLLGVMHASAIAICLVWRLKKYRKGLHHTVGGLAAFFMDISFGVFLPIGGFTFLDQGASGTKALIVATVFCPLILPLAFHDTCFCIFLDGREVVKRTLFSETRIDLSDPGTYIHDNEPFQLSFWISIISAKNQTIQFNSRRIEGDLNSFLQNCKKIQKGA